MTAEVDPLSRLRAEVKAATPGDLWGGSGWEVDHSEDGPGATPHYCVGVNGVGHYPVAWVYDERDAKAIVTATRLARAVVDEGSVEKLARVIDPITFAWGDTPRSGSEAMHSYWEDVEKAKATAQAVLTALASLGLGEE